MTDASTIREIVRGVILLALVGLIGLIFLVATDTDAANLAIIAGPTGVAIGALATLLASTKSQPDPVVQQAVHDAHAAGVGVGVEAGEAKVMEQLAALPEKPKAGR